MKIKSFGSSISMCVYRTSVLGKKDKKKDPEFGKCTDVYSEKQKFKRDNNARSKRNTLLYSVTSHWKLLNYKTCIQSSR